MSETLLISQHLKFLRGHLVALPASYRSFDSNRAAILYFTLSTLDVLGKLDEEVDAGLRQKLIDWIYRLQLKSDSGCPKEAYGFRGSLGFSKPSWYQTENCGSGDIVCTKSGTAITKNYFLYDSAHISQTYVALCSLLILGDDLSRVDRKAVLEGICCGQLGDGSFRGQQGTENDMRFVYCAIAICHILNDFSTINMESVLKFIQRCVNFDGGIGQAPSLESHGGSTFCAIAALAMAGHLWDESVLTHKQIERLVKWALWKQNEGFHGRANKPDDSCYAFWIGGTLKILDAYMFVDGERLRSFIYSTQDRELGGFGKFGDVVPDALHTCYSISALSLMREPNLRIIYPPLNITMRATEHLTNINMNRY